MHRLTTAATGSMDTRRGLLNGSAVQDAVKPGTKKVNLKIKKAAPKPTEAGNWKESEAKSRCLQSPHGLQWDCSRA